MAEPLERSAPPRQRIEDLERSSLDDRSYRIMTLPNKLEVLLIHDPETDKASAALDVNVGSFSDAEDMPGIAHAVEHLLFMGTEKYPQENAYNQYLTAHSGYSNAYTAATSTNYYFELAVSKSTPTSSESPSPDATQESLPISKDDSPLWGALDRFGQFFVAPLFLEDTLDRELKAVDSENKKNLQNDTWRLHQLDKALSNPDHPYNHFSTGSYKTLHDDPLARGVKIRDEFIKFYSTHYSANRMKLVILGREDLDTLEQWTEEIFSQVPNKDLPQKRWDNVPVYTEKELLTETFAKPVFESRTLSMSFLYRDEENLYESHPSRYASHLIGHEGPGSILAYIKEKGLANGLSAGASSLCPGSGLFNISVSLTEEGLKRYREVVKIIFQYIAMMREQPPQEWVVEEMIRMSKVNFRFMQKIPPSRMTSFLASTMQKPYDRRHLMSASSVIRKFDSEAISQALTYLRPDNFRLRIVSQEFPGDWDQKEKWYGTEYKTGKLPEDFIAELKKEFESGQRPKELHFPHRNEFIPSRLDVEKKEVAQPLKAPKLIRNDYGYRTWFKKDDQFWVPKANVHIQFRTPLAYLTPRETVLTALFRELVNDALVEYVYDADISGLVSDLTANSQGLSVSVEGYNDKLHVLLEKVLVSMRDLDVREDRFKIILDRTVRNMRNYEFGQPYHQIGMFSRYLKMEKYHMTEALLQAFEGVTADDVRQFYPQLLSQFFTEILVHGNVHKEEALQITDLVERIMKPKPLPPSQWPIRRNIVLPPGSNYIYARPLKDPNNVNHCIEYSIYLGCGTDIILRAKQLLISQITEEPAFNQLRTKEQLGYVVFSGTSIADNWLGYRILIQSEKDCPYLEGRIEHFLGSVEKILSEMSDAEFESHKRAVINKRLEKLKNLNQEGNRFWTHISSEKYNFLSAEEDVKNIEPLTKADIMATYRKYFSPNSPDRAKVSVHLTAQAKPKLPSVEEQKAHALSVIATILATEKVELDLPNLKTIITETASDTGDATAISEHIITKLTTQLNSISPSLPESKIDAIIDEARAALGLAEVEEQLEHPKESTGGEPSQEHVKDAKTPVLITDVRNWKAGLCLSSGVKPVKDLSEFMEPDAKL